MYCDLSMSLDGFIAGPNVSEELPQGARGEDLRWHGRDGQGRAERPTSSSGTGSRPPYAGWAVSARSSSFPASR